MSKPTKDECTQTKLSKTDESARDEKKPMLLDEDDDEISEISRTFDREFANLFAYPEKL